MACVSEKPTSRWHLKVTTIHCTGDALVLDAASAPTGHRPSVVALAARIVRYRNSRRFICLVGSFLQFGDEVVGDLLHRRALG